MDKVLYKIIKQDGSTDIIDVVYNDEKDAQSKLTAYFSNTNDVSLIPGLVLWALHDNAPKSYKTVIRFNPDDQISKIQVKRQT